MEATRRDRLLGGLIVAVLIPIAIWGISINATTVSVVKTVDRQEKDIADQQAFQLTVTGTLSKIEAQLGDIRDFVRPRR